MRVILKIVSILLILILESCTNMDRLVDISRLDFPGFDATLLG